MSSLDMHSAACERLSEQLIALLAAHRLSDAVPDTPGPWTKVGRYEFRARSGYADNDLLARSPWEAKAVWGRYAYAAPVKTVKDACALALGLAQFVSKSGGRGKRVDIRIEWR